MSDLERQLREDRALRNAARAVVDADIAHLRSVFSPAHMAERAGDEAQDVFDKASEAAGNHKGALAALIAAIVIWFARTPLMALFESDAADGDATSAEADGAAPDEPEEIGGDNDE